MLNKNFSFVISGKLKKYYKQTKSYSYTFSLYVRNFKLEIIEFFKLLLQSYKTRHIFSVELKILLFRLKKLIKKSNILFICILTAKILVTNSK